MSRQRTQLLIALTLSVALVFATAGALGTRYLEATLTDHVHKELGRVARMLEVIVHERAQPGARTAWDALADELGQLGEVRVTLIDKEGTVLGDSAVASSLLDRLDNHSDRPEIAVARDGHPGFSVRHSKTVDERLAYLALPLGKGLDAAVLRVARPLVDLERAVTRLQIVLWLSALGALLTAMVALWVSSRQREVLLAELAESVQRTEEPVRFGQLDAVGALGGAIDRWVERQVDTARALREERQRFERILEGMQEGVLVTGEDGRIVLVNRALREMLLLSNDVLHRPLIEAIRSADLQTTFDRAKNEGTPQASEIETGGLKPRRLLVQVSPLPGQDVKMTVAVFVDVTDIRRLESLRRDFVANVSHELRTPVTAIRSAAETLRTSALQDPEAAATFVDMVDRNAERLGDLVEDLLDLSRIESKAYRLTLEPINVVTVANYCLSLFRERAEKKKLLLKTELGGELHAVRADRKALEQVLTNLIDNAVKYCPQSATITVSAEMQGHSVRLSVIDTGRGIEEKHLPRLFERFYRVDAGRGRDTGGTGLGLSIAKHLVEAMGGTISVESTVAVGTTFHIVLAKA